MFSRHFICCRKTVAVAILIMFAAIFTPPLVAQASTQSGWSVPEAAHDVQVGPDNLPRALNCHLDGNSYAYDQNGTQRFIIGQESNRAIDVGCGNITTWSPTRITDSISALGNTAVASSDSIGSYLSNLVRLYSNTGSLLWEHSVSNECGNPATLGASPIISNGIVVFTYASCYDSYSYFIMGLSESNHSVIYNTFLGGMDNTTSLEWYEGGVMLKSGDGWRYVTDQGIEDLNKQITVGWDAKLTQHIDGSVVYLKHDESDYNICYIVFHTWGQQDILKDADCNREIVEPKTMPNGDLVFFTGHNRNTVVVVHKSTAIQDTVFDIVSPVVAKEDTTSALSMFVDANSKIIVASSYIQDIVPEGWATTQQVRRVAIDVYAENGVRESRWLSSSLGDEDFDPWAAVGISLSNGGVYLNDRASGRLIKVNAPAVSISYADSVRWGVPGSTAPIGLDYVALGDSYSSGEGAPPYDPATDIENNNLCHRSEGAYSRLIADNPDYNLNLRGFAACSGAVTEHIGNNPDLQNTVFLQKDYVSVSTNIVSLSIGGNDIEFGNTISNCVYQHEEEYGEDSSDSEKEAIDRAICLDSLEDAKLLVSSQQLTDKLRDAYTDILSKGGANTKLYVMGYPNLFPESVDSSEVCRWNDHYFASFILSNREVSGSEIIASRKLLTDLNVVIENTVLGLNKPNVEYVDVTQIFTGHELCTDDPYLNKVTAGADPVIGKGSFHPNQKGQQAYADALIQKIHN